MSAEAGVAPIVAGIGALIVVSRAPVDGSSHARVTRAKRMPPSLRRCSDPLFGRLVCSYARRRWVPEEASGSRSPAAAMLPLSGGYMRDYPVERYMRDAKLGEIGEGTSEVQRIVISRALLSGQLAGL